MKNMYIGLLSGTSVDGIDAAIVDFTKQPNVMTTHHHPYPNELTEKIHQLSFPGPDEINQLGQIDRQIGIEFANACHALLKKASIDASDITAIGSHGQNIRHRPHIEHPFSLQVGDPNIIATMTGIPTIADFRRKDMALGGQGAPLAPLVHQALFHHPENDRIILNIGDIANLSFVGSDKNTLIGFDTGPGNTLLDACARKFLNQPYDNGGDWAASGKIDSELLHELLADPYFQLPPPKSTGREYFNHDWVARYLSREIQPEDLQATLSELSAISIANSIKGLTHKNPDVFVCGGGIHNQYLMTRIQANCESLKIQSTTALGVDPNWIEALLFAWLAKQTFHQLPGNAPAVTGASRASILGGIYYP